MSKINRKLQKLFASTGSAVGQFGSAQLGTKQLSLDLDTLQALTTRFLNGWNDAVISGEKLPPLEEMNCLGYIFSQQIAYILQEGIPEYLSTKEYHQNSMVKKAGTNEIYSSKINTNIGNALPSQIDDANWQYLGDFGDIKNIGLEKLSETILSTDSFIEFIDLDDGYNHKFVFENMTVSVDDVYLTALISRNNGSSYITTANYHDASFSSTSNDGSYKENLSINETAMIIGSNSTGGAPTYGIGNASGENFNSEIIAFNPLNNTEYKTVLINNVYWTADGYLAHTHGSGSLKDSVLKYNAIKFLLSSGNMVSGKITHYRYK